MGGLGSSQRHSAWGLRFFFLLHSKDGPALQGILKGFIWGFRGAERCIEASWWVFLEPISISEGLGFSEEFQVVAS